MRRSAMAMAVLCACLVHCRPAAPDETPAAAPPGAEPPPPARPETENEDEPERSPEHDPEPERDAQLRFPGTEHTHDFILERLARASPRSFSPVGSTSTVFRAVLHGPVDAAFKTPTHERPLGPIAEVAAYRLARCLRLPNVPPAISRSVPLSQIDALLDPGVRARWPTIRERVVLPDDGSVRGAAIYWVRDLTDIGLDGRRGAARWQQWLRVDGQLPESRRGLAASVSTMLAFDYLIGNFDRWSGGNARGSADRSLVYMRDHDLAFPHAMRPALHRRLWERMLRAERFSKRFYRELKHLTRARFELELSRDPQGALGQLLVQRQIDALFDRRDALLSHIESLILVHGEDRVLVFQ